MLGMLSEKVEELRNLMWNLVRNMAIQCIKEKAILYDVVFLSCHIITGQPHGPSGRTTGMSVPVAMPTCQYLLTTAAAFHDRHHCHSFAFIPLLPAFF